MGWVLSIHIPHWSVNGVFFGTFTLPALAPFLLASLVFWAMGCFAQQRPKLDASLVMVYLTVGLAFWLVPSRFSAA